MASNIESLKCVLLDLIMPQLNGFEVLEEMNKRHYSDVLPVFVITSLSSSENRRRALALGAKDFVYKPFDAQHILSKVNNLVAFYEKLKSSATLQYRLLQEATFDSLTGIYNRYGFELAAKGYSDTNKLERFATLMFDLDNFKLVNDENGHSVGDVVLKKISDLMLSVFSSPNIVCRLGGDEFMIFMPNYSSKNNVELKIQELFAMMKEPLVATSSPVTFSCGVTFRETKSELSQSEIYSEMDEALYQSKSRGKNTYTFYNENSFTLNSDEKKADVIFYTDDKIAKELIASSLVKTANVDEAICIEDLNNKLQKHIDILVLDFDTLLLDSYSYNSLLEQSINQKCKVLALIKEGNLEVVKKALSFGIDDIIYKPFLASQLVRRISELKNK